MGRTKRRGKKFLCLGFGQNEKRERKDRGAGQVQY
jgi:hypothetical protein